MVRNQRRGWERRQRPVGVRETYRVDAPSPSQEILARHDRELAAAQIESPPKVIRF